MIRILIVDDQNFTRKALRAILKSEANFIVVGEAENGVKALELMHKNHIDIAIVDLDMPEMDGFELTQKICKNFSKTQVIILSSHEDRYSINKAVNFGAKGYLLKDTSVNEVIDTINYVQRGYFQLGPGLFEKLISESINYDLETSEQLSELEIKSERDLTLLKQEIIERDKQVRQEVCAELDLEIEGLKIELAKGLNKFQTQVHQQLKSNFQDFANSRENSQFRPEFLHQRYLEISNSIQSIDNKYQSYLNKLTKEIAIWRYCLIFLLLIFFIEKTAIIFF